jgi:lipopolysaccharide heptosyltransferase II
VNRTRRIVVVRTDRLGDVVLATPLVRALRNTFPDAHLAALVRPYARDVLVGNPHLDEILVDDRDGAGRGARGFWRGVAALRRRRFDTALLLLPTSRAAWMLFFAGIRRRIGVGHKFYEVVTGMESVSRHGYVPLRHEADYCLDLGRRLGVRATDLDTEIFLADEDRDRGAQVLASAGAGAEHVLVGIHMGSGGSSPNWTPERYLDLAGAIAARAPARTRIVFTGEERIPRLPASDRMLDLRGGRPLRELVAVISRLHVLVSSSTGPMHVAAALGVPTVSLFCPLPACSPTLWGPRGNRARIVQPPEDSCGTRCPGDPKICRFENIEVDQVADAVRQVLASSEAGVLRGGADLPA